MDSTQLVQLDPAKVLADDNIRFSLNKFQIDAMAGSILASGGVNTPVEVEPLPKGAANGFTHKLTVGFYRHAAVLMLNKDQKAGLTLPALVRTPADAVDRLKRQVSENHDRESLSPMDTANSIQKLLDAGVSRDEVRSIFARPTGVKGLKMAPASNAWVNIMLSFLDLPKGIQAKVHDGRLPVKAAYELTKAAPEDREAILAKAEEVRQRDQDREAREDAKLARDAETAEAKAEREAKAQAKVDGATAAQAQAEADLKAAEATLAKAQAAKKAGSSMGALEKEHGKPFDELDESVKKAFAERTKALKADVRGAEKVLGNAKKAFDKADRAARALTEPKAETEAEPEPEPTRTGKAGKGKTKGGTVTAGDIQTASKAMGKPTSSPVLTLPEAKAAVAQLTKSKFPKVKAIGEILTALLAGATSSGAAETDLSVITGERKTKKA